jgi:tetratricopeptide (TPR) repeat protein
LSKNLQANDTVYTAGLPAKKNRFVFHKGNMVAVTTKRLISDKGGYTIIYDAATLPGMSGSGVYNTAGKMVTIHGIGDRYRLNSETDKDLYPETYDENIFERKVGSNRGISVNWLQQALIKKKINLFRSTTQSDYLVVNDNVSLTADDLFFNGYNKFLDPGENWKTSKRQAIEDFTDAIILNPKHALAYLVRAACYRQLQEFDKALADLSKSIQLEGRSGSYQERGVLKLNNFNDVNGALEDFNKSIELGSDNAASYGNRALLKISRISDANGALTDLNKAINIDPELALAYNNRAVLKYTKFNDSDGALDDISKAIMLNPNLSLCHSGWFEGI